MTGAAAGEQKSRMDSPLADPFQPIAAAPGDQPFVVAQLGQSLDGRIATVTGESRYINGAAALDHLHRLRAAVDAVVVGAGTIIADDPQLTVRRVAGRNPARVVIDPTGRTGNQGKWLTRDGTPLVLVSAGAACAAALAIVLVGEVSTIIITEVRAMLLPLAAFAGALAVCFSLEHMARRIAPGSIAALLLTGIAMNALAGAVIGLCTYLANDEQLRSL